MTDAMSINVDGISPMTPELLDLGRRRVDDIVKQYGRLLSIWGSTTALYGPNNERLEQVPSIADLCAYCYAQGVRDTSAVSAAIAFVGEGKP